MKKISSLAVLLSCASVLGACSIFPDQSSKATDTSKTASSQMSSSEEKKVDYSLYDKVISDYGKVLNGVSASSLGLNHLASLNVKYSRDYGIDHVLYDFDKNGTNELAISLVSPDGEYRLLDLYTIADGRLVKLTNMDNVMDYIGERMTLTPLSDGNFLYHGDFTTKHQYILYKLNSAGNALEKVKEGAEVADLGSIASELNLSDWPWKPVSVGTTKGTTSTSTAMDINAIQNGDFSSVAGTWRNGSGETLTFDAKGLVHERGYVVSFKNARQENGHLLTFIETGGPAPGGALRFIPKGVTMTSNVLSDASDSSRDRLLNQNSPEDQEIADKFFYKEEK